MSIFIFLTVVQALVAAALVGVILMQRSEGGGLGVGGSPSGLMSARGAADFLTRMTAILAVLFVALSIALAALAVGTTTGRKLDTSLDRTVPAAPPPPADPLAANPLAPNPVTGATPAAPAAAPAAAAPTGEAAPADPLAGTPKQ